jgi:hypothetical protein
MFVPRAGPNSRVFGDRRPEGPLRNCPGFRLTVGHRVLSTSTGPKVALTLLAVSVTFTPK